MTDVKPDTSTVLPLDQYDWIIVSFSGGKDSLACVLHLLELGAPKDRIELWHQAVDGRPGVDRRFFDWPCTESYCREVARALGLPIKFQWREGGFEREINKLNEPLAPAAFELPDGSIGMAGGTGEPRTRLAFPDPVGNLSFRWCSAVLKIDVASAAINNDPRFKRAKVLELTGERRQESEKRALYATVEEHKSTTKSRRVDHWRPVLDWAEEQVWDIIRRWRIRLHPGYHLGWGRLSCISCIFGDPDQWASVRAIHPELFRKISDYEQKFGRTISMKKLSVEQLASVGRSFIPGDPVMVQLAMSEELPYGYASLAPGEEWILPAGAFKKSGGPL